MNASLPRRTVLRGMTASAVAAAAVPWLTSPASAKPQDPTTDWSDFGRKVAPAFDALHNVGGAVAVVSADQVLHMATFGVRNLQGRRPVTPSTLFRVGSTTKSMTFWFQPIEPSSTYVATSAAAIDLVVEPTRNNVEGVTGRRP